MRSIGAQRTVVAMPGQLASAPHEPRGERMPAGTPAVDAAMAAESARRAVGVRAHSSKPDVPRPSRCTGVGTPPPPPP
eukprot:325803-Chlamydomonas_euryale.AAC.14